jgi:hypothetical protein
VVISREKGIENGKSQRGGQNVTGAGESSKGQGKRRQKEQRKRQEEQAEKMGRRVKWGR